MLPFPMVEVAGYNHPANRWMAGHPRDGAICGTWSCFLLLEPWALIKVRHGELAEVTAMPSSHITFLSPVIVTLCLWVSQKGSSYFNYFKSSLLRPHFRENSYGSHTSSWFLLDQRSLTYSWLLDFLITELHIRFFPRVYSFGHTTGHSSSTYT